jgi:hypothetical protein
MLWAAIGIGALIVITFCAFIFAAMAVASRADDQMDEWLAERERERD